MYWRVTDTNNTCKEGLGLKKYRYTCDSPSIDQTGTIDDNSSDLKAYLKGANTAISMGAIALACLVGSVLLIALLKLCEGWTGGRARFIAIICSFAACILIVVGTITFDQQLTSNVKSTFPHVSSHFTLPYIVTHY
jgi:CBS domain containing-hemolysin-like protein